MSADPFAEPGETERTMFRPRPSGTAGSAASGSAVLPGAVERRAPVLAVVPRVGANPLVAAAAPVLAAAVRIAGDRGQPPEAERLRDAMAKGIRGFETDALATGMETRPLRAARYALCATIDDLVLSTPWGMQSSWVQHSLTSIFHGEVIGGERFFDILETMQTDMGHNAEVVELMYLCTSLGFEGRYRVMPRGVAALSELRDGVYRTLRQRKGDFERELSPHWRGLAAAAKWLGSRIPLWARALATFVLAALIFLLLSFLLANASDVAFAEFSGLPPPQALPMAHVKQAAPPPDAPVPVAPPQSNFFKRVHEFLAPEIREGLVQVFEDAQTVTVRLINRNMFASGQAVLGPTYPALLVRIGDALQAESGVVAVNGYTDNQPIRTARFPSNFELSKARADVVAAALRARLTNGGRLTSVGKGESGPLAPNETADGRQQNRRTEIVLTRPADGP